MELTHIEHLGIAVKSIEACLPYYEEVLGLKCYNIEEVAGPKLRIFSSIVCPSFPASPAQ